MIRIVEGQIVADDLIRVASLTNKDGVSVFIGMDQIFCGKLGVTVKEGNEGDILVRVHTDITVIKTF